MPMTWARPAIPRRSRKAAEPGRVNAAPGSFKQALDVLVNVSRASDANLGTGVALARRDFVSLLRDENVERDLLLGTLYGPDGRAIEGWVTWRGRSRINLRGQHGFGYDGPGAKWVGYRYCSACGQLMHSPLGTPLYLYPAPPCHHVIHHAGTVFLVVPSDLVKGLPIKPTRDFHVRKLRVMDPPPDGFGLMERGGPGDNTDQ